MDGTRRYLVNRDAGNEVLGPWFLVLGPSLGPWSVPGPGSRSAHQGPLDGPSTKYQGPGTYRGPGTRSVEVQESQPLNLEVVRVVAGQVGADAHQHDHGSGADETARDELLPDERAGGIDVLADVGAQRHDAPVDGEPPRGVVAIGGRDDGRARPEGRQPPGGAAAARDRDERLRIAAIGERHRRLAERLRMILVQRVARSARRVIGGTGLGVADDGVERVHGPRGVPADGG